MSSLMQVEVPIEAVFSALGHPARLAIIRKLEPAPCCVCDLVAVTGLAWSTVSRHLSVMKAAGVIADEKKGLQVYYRILRPCVIRFIRCLESGDDSWDASGNCSGTCG
jgi:DNA-binding transcriptional ArsR family regulator